VAVVVVVVVMVVVVVVSPIVASMSRESTNPLPRPPPTPNLPTLLPPSHPPQVWNDFNRVMTTAFNGASNIVQEGGLAILDEEGMKEIEELMKYYLENAKLLREMVVSLGYKVR